MRRRGASSAPPETCIFGRAPSARGDPAIGCRHPTILGPDKNVGVRIGPKSSCPWRPELYSFWGVKALVKLNPVELNGV